MNRFESDFAYGRDLVKKLLIGSVAACVFTLFTQGAIQLAFMGLTVACVVGAIYILVKYCRCPHCGKVIFFGMLAIRQCPRCKRNLFTGQKMKKSKKY